MAKVLICVLLLLCTAFYDCDGMAVAGSDRQTNWLSAMTPLVRHERDTNNNGTMSWGFEEDSCNAVTVCQVTGEGVGSTWQALEKFQFEDIYEKLVLVCPTMINRKCWDDECKDEYTKKWIEYTNTMIEWMCRHKDGFKDTSCYQTPFADRMMACTEEMDMGVLEVEGPFMGCVLSELDDLPGCSRDNFFATFIHHTLSERMKVLTQLE